MEIKKPIQKKIKIDTLTLESGADILIKEFNLIMNQPLLIELAILGEDNYRDALATLNFDRASFIGKLDMAEEEIMSVSDFEWIITILRIHDAKRINIQIFLEMCFKNYNIKLDLEQGKIIFTNKNNDNNVIKVTSLNYQILKDYINKIFYMEQKDESSFNTDSPLGERIAKKIAEGRKKVNAKSGQKHVLTNAISSLAVELKLPLTTVYKEFTLYQFYTQLKRQRKYDASENALRFILAGARDVEREDWSGDL